MNSFTATCVLLDTKHDIQRATGENKTICVWQNYHFKADRETHKTITPRLNGKPAGSPITSILDTGCYWSPHKQEFMEQLFTYAPICWKYNMPILNAVSNKFLPDNRGQLNMNEKWWTERCVMRVARCWIEVHSSATKLLSCDWTVAVPQPDLAWRAGGPRINVSLCSLLTNLTSVQRTTDSTVRPPDSWLENR